MGKHDAKYSLKEVVEIDKDFFSTEIEAEKKGKPLKRGRGSKKNKVSVMAESIPVEDERSKKENPAKQAA